MHSLSSLCLAFQKGLKLPGSRPDVVRTKLWSGPSPVGGSAGGTESQNVMTLDEFELQAAHYNMACAHAKLKNVNEVRCVAEYRSMPIPPSIPASTHGCV